MKLKDGKRLKKFAKKTAPKVKKAIVKTAKITKKYAPRVAKGVIGGVKAVGRGYQKAADHIDFEAITGMPDKPRGKRKSQWGNGFNPNVYLPDVAKKKKRRR